jgi:pimeloyl-ACP methyl ester carboxylesterase
MWASFPDDVRREILETGRWERPSLYDPDPCPITRDLIEDGRLHLLMEGPIPVDGPVRIVQGGRDPDVPESHARALAALITTSDLGFEHIADGDHRLSRPQDLARLAQTADELASLLAR